MSREERRLDDDLQDALYLITAAGFECPSWIGVTPYSEYRWGGRNAMESAHL